MSSMWHGLEWFETKETYLEHRGTHALSLNPLESTLLHPLDSSILSRLDRRETRETTLEDLATSYCFWVSIEAPYLFVLVWSKLQRRWRWRLGDGFTVKIKIYLALRHPGEEYCTTLCRAVAIH